MKKVYLAGPITGASFDQSESWRDELKFEAAHSHGTFDEVEFYSPLRGKDYLKGESEISDSYSDTLYSTAKAIMERDFYDVQTADALIVNFDGAKKVSIGTVMEIAWAYQRRIPVIVIRGADLRHDHSMLNQATWYKVDTIQGALKALSYLFNP